MTETTGLPTPEELRARLEALRAERPWLLPHHGAMAAAAPDLHAAYGGMYAALTRTDRHLDGLTREFIWLCILVAGQEAVGTHHLDLFRRAGGSADQARLAFHLAGHAGAATGFAFLERHWQDWFPEIDPGASYLDGLFALAGDLVPRLTVHLAMAAVHMLLRQEWGIAAQIRAVYATPGEDREEKLVEALSLAIWPAGVNRFVDACAIWHRLMRDGQVAPSPRFRAWADMPGQGAFVRDA